MSNATPTRRAEPADLTPQGPYIGIPKHDRLPTVALLIGKQTGVIRVFSSEAEANERRDMYNADAELDWDAPYRVESWAVSS